jgi:hypothetical protein
MDLQKSSCLTAVEEGLELQADTIGSLGCSIRCVRHKDSEWLLWPESALPGCRELVRADCNDLMPALGLKPD